MSALSDSPERPISVGLQQAAEILGCSASALRRRAQRGDIPSHRLGNRYLFQVARLRDWMDAGGDRPDPVVVLAAPKDGELPDWLRRRSRRRVA